jgi:hypothetical protein
LGRRRRGRCLAAVEVVDFLLLLQKLNYVKKLS